MIYKVLLAGDGGQGVQTIADLICRAAFKKGLEVTEIPNYGLEQRGGASLSFVQISDQKIGYPKFTCADLLLIISNQGRERSLAQKGANTQIIDIKDFKDELEAKKISLQNINIFFLKVMVSFFEENGIFTKVDLEQVFEEKFGKKENWLEIKDVFNK